VETVVLRGEKKRIYDTWRVDRIVWGNVSGSFREGRTYFERADYENAAAKFLVASTNDPRHPVQAAARLLAARSYLKLATTNPDRISDAIEQAERYIDDHPEGAGLPVVRALLARATWLSGEPATAALLYRELFQEAAADAITPGYSVVPCLRAGLYSARSYLSAGETLPARELYTTLEQRANSAIAALGEDSRDRSALTRLSLEARAGEGFVLITSKQNRQAITFFQSALSSAGKTESALRYASLLGLGEAQVAEKRFREAQLNFAKVSSIDHTDRDRVARALFRLAESTRELSDPGSAGTVRMWLQSVSTDYGDTPWAGPARELLETL
jgi:tetratricopeptide (TPR) repeat protein